MRRQGFTGNEPLGQGNGLDTQQLKRLRHSGQCRIGKHRQLVIIKPHHGELGRDGQTLRFCLMQRSYCHLIIKAEERSQLGMRVK